MLPDRIFARLIVCTLFITLTATAAAARQRTDFGTLSIQVRPPDAEIFIDGERWTSPEGTEPFRVQLAPGEHRVEIRSPGRQSFVRQITIRAGETLPLNVALTKAEPVSAPPPPSSTRPPAPRQPVGPSGSTTQITRSEDGFVFAPDFRVTEVNHHTAGLVGAYVGYVFGGQFLFGAGGYWQANSTDGSHIAYAGPVVEWRMFTNRTIGFNLHGLVGGGWRYSDYGYYWDGGYGHHSAPAGYGYGYGMPYGYHDEAFFVAEPEAQVVIRFSPSARLQGGVGYRATSASGTSGVSGSISVQIGR